MDLVVLHREPPVGFPTSRPFGDSRRALRRSFRKYHAIITRPKSWVHASVGAACLAYHPMIGRKRPETRCPISTVSMKIARLENFICRVAYKHVEASSLINRGGVTD